MDCSTRLIIGRVRVRVPSVAQIIRHQPRLVLTEKQIPFEVRRGPHWGISFMNGITFPNVAQTMSSLQIADIAGKRHKDVVLASGIWNQHGRGYVGAKLRLHYNRSQCPVVAAVKWLVNNSRRPSVSTSPPSSMTRREPNLFFVGKNLKPRISQKIIFTDKRYCHDKT